MEIKVLYEDNHIIAVLKPSGVLSQGDRTGEASMFGEVKKYLKEKYKKPGNVFLGLVHRLDKPVSGIMLFAKTSKGAGRLSDQFRNRQIQKTYHALVSGTPSKKEGSVVEKVKKISFFAQGFTGKSDEEILREIKRATKTRTAELSYEVVKSDGKYSLVKVMPKTGRFHQIRIQMAEMGNPVLGDRKYGGPGWKDEKSIALCATGISFMTATGEKKIDLSVPVPENWKEYFDR